MAKKFSVYWFIFCRSALIILFFIRPFVLISVPFLFFHFLFWRFVLISAHVIVYLPIQFEVFKNGHTHAHARTHARTHLANYSPKNLLLLKHINCLAHIEVS